MDHVMLVLSVAALVVGSGLAVVAWRLLRGGQRRAARIAALEDAARIDQDEADDAAVETDLVFDDYREPVPAPFATSAESAAPRRRWATVTAVVVVVATIGAGVFAVVRPAALDAAAVMAAPIARSSRTPLPASVAPLALLSLTHTTHDDALTVTGLVENPANGAPAPRVVAVVYVFDADGAFSASARADVEFHALRPGETSPFTVTVPITSPVTRYRVGFRREDGSVIAHIDRRGQPPTGMTGDAR